MMYLVIAVIYLVLRKYMPQLYLMAFALSVLFLVLTSVFQSIKNFNSADETASLAFLFVALIFIEVLIQTFFEAKFEKEKV